MKNYREKKAIVLFISLMFILAISALIVKNLADTEKYIDESNKDIATVKSVLVVKNLKEEFLNYFVKHINDIDELLENKPFSDKLVLEYDNIKANITFEKYEEKFDVNVLIEKEESKYKNIEDLFADNNVSDFYIFKELVIKNNKIYGSIENTAQLNFIINEFKTQSGNSQIKEIQKFLSYISINEDQQLLLCNMDINISNEIINSEFIYDITNKDIKGFNIAFK